MNQLGKNMPPFRTPTRPKPQEPAAPLTRRQKLAASLARLRRLAPVLLGALLALGVVMAYSWLMPTQPALTEGDVNQAIARAMASATPRPPIAPLIYEAIMPSVVQIDTKTADKSGDVDRGHGTGVVLDEMGNILTSLHVIDGAGEITVVFADGTESLADVVNTVPANDIALLQARTLPPLVIPATLGNPRASRVGDEAFVVGHPFGLVDSFTVGTISGFRRNFPLPQSGQKLPEVIQFDAAVNPGNSGGPLVNRSGEVIGIVTGLVNPTDQNVFVGIGFAVPIDVAASAAGSPPY